MAKVSYIDPNPDGMDLINHEDLSIFVELLTTKKDRTEINVDSEEKSYRFQQGGKKIPIRFLKGSDIDGNGKESLTTHYTEINTNFASANPDLETLGITGIDIDFNSAYTPLIKINFTDVRGQLFAMGNESPYNVFFNLPYPMFELTIKGYYGNSVKYCLHLTKFNGKLNDKTGNFEIQCDFVGYTYAFLSDMLMGLLRGIVETDIATDYIRQAKEDNPEFLPFNELNERISKVNKEISKLKHDNNEIAKLSLGENGLIAINEVKSKLRKFLKSVTKSKDPNNNESIEILNLNRFGIVREPESNVLKENINNRIITHNESIKNKIFDVNNQIGATTGSKYYINPEVFIFKPNNGNIANDIRRVDFRPQIYFNPLGQPSYITNNGNPINEDDIDLNTVSVGDRKYRVSDIIINNEIDEDVENTNEYYDDFRNKLNRISDKVSPLQEMRVYDLRKMFSELERVENSIREDLETTREKVSEELISKIEEILRFKPTIRNMTFILTQHVHILMECIKDVAQQVGDSFGSDRADQLNSVVANKKWSVASDVEANCSNGNKTDVEDFERPSIDNIYPFPDYKERNEDRIFEDKWIGSKAPTMPEVIFIEQLLDGLLNAKRKDNELLDELEYGEDGWYPINPFDTKLTTRGENPWKQFRDVTNPDDVVRHMLLRMSIFLGYSHNLISDEEVRVMAKLEANNAFNNIDNPEIKENIGLYGDSSGSASSFYSTIKKYAKTDGNTGWRNASRIWNGDKILNSFFFKESAVGFIGEWGFLGYTINDSAIDLINAGTSIFALTSLASANPSVGSISTIVNWFTGSDTQNNTEQYVEPEIELDEYTYVALPKLNYLYDKIQNSGYFTNIGQDFDAVKYEKNVGADTLSPSLSEIVSIPPENQTNDSWATLLDINPTSVGTKFFIPLATPKLGDFNFFSGDELVAKSNETIVTGALTNADRIKVRDNGKIFFSSLIGGNSKGEENGKPIWKVKEDDGATTIDFIKRSRYDDTQQGSYPELPDDIFDNLDTTSPVLNMEDVSVLPEEGLSKYSGMFFGKWGIHEFRRIKENIYGEIPAWVRFFANTTDRYAFSGHRVVTNGKSKQTIFDIIKDPKSGVVSGVSNKNTLEKSDISKSLNKIYSGDLETAITPCSFYGEQINLLSDEYRREGGNTIDTLLEYDKSGSVNDVAIPFLGFECYSPEDKSLRWSDANGAERLKNLFVSAQYPIFGSDLYHNQDIYGKAYLFLHSIPWDGLTYLFKEGFFGKYGNKYSNVLNVFDACGEANEEIDAGGQCNRGGGLFTHYVQHFFNQRAGFIEAPNLWIAFLGAILWRYRSSTDPIIWENNGYSLIPLQNNINQKPKKDSYCLPNIPTNEIMGFFTASDKTMSEFEKEIDPMTGGVKFFANLFSDDVPDTAYVSVERPISRMPEGMGDKFINEFIKFATGVSPEPSSTNTSKRDNTFEDIRKEYDIFYKGNGQYATEKERVLAWLNWNAEMNNNPNGWIGSDAPFNSPLNPNIADNYIVASRDDKYSTYFEKDIFKKNHGINNNFYIEFEKIRKDSTLSDDGKYQQAISLATTMSGTPFNFFLEMRDGTNAQKNLFSYISRTSIIVNSSRRLWAANVEDDQVENIEASHPFRWEPKKTQTYVETFYTEYNRLLNKEREDNNDDEELKRRLFNTIESDEIKLQLYKTIKSIYDKWIPGSKCVLELCSGSSDNTDTDDCPNLIDTFRFIDRAYNDIGDEFLINPIDMVKHMVNDYNISMYDYLARVLVDNNFDFIPLPTFINYNSPTAINDVFKPQPFNNIKSAGGPTFVCMYIGERSKHLNLGAESHYQDDGFHIGRSDCPPPEDFQEKTYNTDIDTSESVDNEIIKGLSSNSSSGGKASVKAKELESRTYIPAFRVAYGDQNQSIFKNFRLDQSEFTETEESLRIIDDISDQKLGNTGQNLFNIYRTRSYSAQIDTLGNAQIQPFMYFQLDNVPMFAGAYTIINVKHKIKPNHMSTQFKGVRVRKTKTPMVKSTTIMMNLLGSLNEVDTEGVTLEGLISGEDTNTESLRPETVYRGANRNSSGKPAWSGCIRYKVPEKSVGLEIQAKGIGILNYTLPEIGIFMQEIGAIWYGERKTTNYGDTIYYNDFSKLNGGYVPKHSGHEDGVEVDFRMFRLDKSASTLTWNVEGTNTPHPDYDREGTKQFIELLLNESIKDGSWTIESPVKSIYFNDPVLQEYFKNDYKNRDKFRSDGVVRQEVGHDNHIHITFGTPDRILNDKDNGYLICDEYLADNVELERISRTERSNSSNNILDNLGKV